jgi:exodeoxyribonuclease VII small subunit
MTNKAKDIEKDISFEQALAKLEEYANLLSRDDVGLEDAIRAYEEGVRYYGICNRILSDATQKIEIFGAHGEAGKGADIDD